MSEPLQQLLQEPRARRNVLVEVDRISDGVVTRERWSEETVSLRTDEADHTTALKYSGRLNQALNVETAIDRGGTFGGLGIPEYGVLELENSDGELDYLRSGVSVDGQYVRALMTGFLPDGTAVSVADATETPIFEGAGVGRPAVGDQAARITVKGKLHKLENALLTRQFSPPCLCFPGTSAGCLDFGDVLDQTGGFTIGFWVYLDNSATTGQLAVTKDTGAAGWGISIGNAGSGAVRFFIREQSIVSTDTPTGTISSDTWHHVACVNAPADGKRYVYVDGALKASTTVTGSPAGNSASFKIGAGLAGKISEVRAWSTARTLAQIQAERFLPQLGTTSGLAALLRLDEGTGTTTNDSKSGSSLSATLGTGVLWDTSGWCGDELEATNWPAILGAPQDVPLVPIDPSGNTWAIGRGPGDLPLSFVSSVKSNHNPLAGGSYTVDLARGLVTLTGAPSGELTASPVYTPWGAALSPDGVDDYVNVTAACPAGAMSLSVVVSATDLSSSRRDIAGYRNGTSPGLRLLSYGTAGANRLVWGVRSDTGIYFEVQYATTIPAGRRVVLLAELDPSAGKIRLYVDAVLAGETAISGTWNTVLSSFVLARTPDAASFYLKGTVDEPAIFNRILTEEERALLVMAPVDPTMSGLVHLWHLDEATGTSAASAVGGNPFSITGATWTHGRIGPSDLALPVLWSAGYTSDDVNPSTVAAYCAETTAESGWYVSEEETRREVLDVLLRGVHSTLTPGPDGLLWLERVEIPTGEPDEGAEFTERDLDDKAPIDALDIIRESPVYLVKVLHARNWSPADRANVAGLITSDPEAFRFAITEWRTAASPPADILEDFPQARVLVIESCLLRRTDAAAEARRVLPFYGPDRVGYAVEMKSSALALRCMGKISLSVRNAAGTVRLGMDDKLFLVTGLTKVDRDASLRIWA